MIGVASGGGVVGVGGDGGGDCDGIGGGVGGGDDGESCVLFERCLGSMPALIRRRTAGSLPRR